MKVMVDIEFSLSLEDVDKVKKVAEYLGLPVPDYMSSIIMKTVNKDFKKCDNNVKRRAH